MRLYDICLREVLKTRGIELFEQLEMLQIKGNPLNGSYQDMWVKAAASNPSIMDWLVLKTDCTMVSLVELVYSVAMEACCIEVLNWFIEPLRSEFKMNGSPDQIVWTVLTDPINIYNYTRARITFIKKDDVPTAHWLLQNQCLLLQEMYALAINLGCRGWYAPRVHGYLFKMISGMSVQCCTK